MLIVAVRLVLVVVIAVITVIAVIAVTALFEFPAQKFLLRRLLSFQEEL